MAMGSWLRYIIGILISLDVLRTYFFGGGIQMTTVLLSVVFLALAALYLVRKF
jgi:hypothetical protein